MGFHLHAPTCAKRVMGSKTAHNKFDIFGYDIWLLNESFKLFNHEFHFTLACAILRSSRLAISYHLTLSTDQWVYSNLASNFDLLYSVSLEKWQSRSLTWRPHWTPGPRWFGLVRQLHSHRTLFLVPFCSNLLNSWNQTSNIIPLWLSLTVCVLQFRWLMCIHITSWRPTLFVSRPNPIHPHLRGRRNSKSQPIRLHRVDCSSRSDNVDTSVVIDYFIRKHTGLYSWILGVFHLW